MIRSRNRYDDILIGLILFVAGLYAYTSTLAPTVLEGDAALFQYTPYVLGVTYPTGYPLYILLGKVWLTLFPFGEIAWRMNLFSAICSAAALPLIYGATHRLLAKGNEGRFAALTATLIFATLPTFWRWSTETKIYGLNILLFSSVLYFVGRFAERDWKVRGAGLEGSSGEVGNKEWALRIGGGRFTWSLCVDALSRLAASPFTLPFLLGLELTVHSTTVLLLPGLFLFVWLRFRPWLLDKKVILSTLLFLVIPGLLYLYIPLRAEGLIAQYGRAEAIRLGLLADFYHSGLSGWVRYFTAADFTGGVVTNWGLVPTQFFTVYIQRLLPLDFPPLGISLGLIGGMALAFTRPRIFWPLFLLYALPIPFVLTYGQGEQSAFLLPSFLIFSIFSGNFLVFTCAIVARLSSRFTAIHHSPRLAAIRLLRVAPLPLSCFTSPLLFLSLIFLLILPQTRYNINWLKSKWDRANYTYWADALAHPLTPNVALLAEWGDLTSFWYMQYAEGRRPDLRGLYPPTIETVRNYLDSQNSAVYIAGPSSKKWATDIKENYQLIPWGRLVRIAPKTIEPQTLLPVTPHPSHATFDSKLRLLGVDYPLQANDGQPYRVTLTWQTLVDLPAETTLSLRLSQGDVIAAQLDDTLLSGWFPGNTLPAGQYILSYMPIPIPPGTLPGKYRLQLVTYLNAKQPWPLADASTLLDLGEVELTLPPVEMRTDSGFLNPGYDFNGEIKLVDYEYTVSRVGQGKGFGVKLLWQAQNQPSDNYTLLAELVDREDRVLRSVRQPPVGGRAPTASWQPRQYVRDQVDLVLPAGAPVGEEAARVRLSWLRPDGSKLTLRRWLLPLGDHLDLDWLAVTEKEGRIFTAPATQYPNQANFDNKIRLLGYNTSLSPEAQLKSGFQFNRSACAAKAEACQVHFEFIWQGLNEMDQLYSVFLHLVDEQGHMVTQQDKIPGERSKQPTTGWLLGEVVLDPIDLTLPPDLPPGLYSLRIGLYLPPDGTRLPALGSQGDFVTIGTIRVIP